jgi:hypothetical protein
MDLELLGSYFLTADDVDPCLRGETIGAGGCASLQKLKMTLFYFIY